MKLSRLVFQYKEKNNRETYPARRRIGPYVPQHIGGSNRNICGQWYWYVLWRDDVQAVIVSAPLLQKPNREN